MRVLVACEYSGTVRDAFIARGHYACSLDILETEVPGNHIKGNVESVGLFSHLIGIKRWDLVVFHPPCTAMALCGNRHYAKDTCGYNKRLAALVWTKAQTSNILRLTDRLCVENPASVLFKHLRDKPLRRIPSTTQYIQPNQFGHLEQKKTGLQLYNLPELVPTDDVYDEMMKLPKAERERIFYMSPSEDRSKLRSRFYQGFADAMAEQWGGLTSVSRQLENMEGEE